MAHTDARTSADPLERVRDYICRAARVQTLADEEDIFEAGYVNSLFLAQLMTFVEQDLETPVEDADLTIDNFRSVAAIARLVQGKNAA